MNGKRWQVIAFLAVCCFTAYAQQVKSVVKGDDGKPFIATVHFVPSSGGGPLQYANSGPDGSFLIPNLPPGNYETCISVQGGGYTNPCHWTSLKLPYSQTSAGATNLQLTAKKGSIITVHIVDLGGFLSSGSPLIVGIFAPGGLYYPMLQGPQNGATRSYTFTIPYGIPATFYVGGQNFEIHDAAGTVLPGAGQGIALSQASNAPDPVFTFNIAKKLN